MKFIQYNRVGDIVKQDEFSVDSFRTNCIGEKLELLLFMGKSTLASGILLSKIIICLRKLKLLAMI
ncbi:MAG TPA: hypothetical protein DCW31_10255 [Lactobacillus sp.]|nr:hypothetical protein [Lactobacillus sp.]